jgi:CHAT domain-containing protein
MKTTLLSILVVLSFLSFTTPLSSQVPLNNRPAYDVLDDMHRYAINYHGWVHLEDSSLRWLDSIIIDLIPKHTEADTVNLILARFCKGNDLAMKEKHKEALVQYDSLLTLSDISRNERVSYELIAQTHANAGLSYSKLFKIEEALLETNKAIDIAKSNGLYEAAAEAAFNNATPYYNVGDTTNLGRMIEEYEHINFEAQTLERRLRNVFMKFNKAALFEIHGKNTRSDGRLEKADSYFKKSIRLCEEVLDTLDVLREEDKKLGNPNKRQNIQGEVFQGVVFTTFRLGLLYTFFDDSISSKKAIYYAEKAIKSYPLLASTANIFKANAYSQMQNWQSAFDTIQLAIKQSGFKSDSLFSYTPIYLKAAPIALANTAGIFSTKSQILMNYYINNERDDNFKYLKQSFIEAKNATLIADSLLLLFTTEIGIRSVAQIYSNTYQSVTTLAYNIWLKTKDKSYLDTMLIYMEKQKAVTLRNAMFRRLTEKQYTGERKRLFDREKSFRDNLSSLQNEWVNASTSKRFKNLNTVKINYGNFIDSLHQLSPNTEGGRFYAERFNTYVPTIAEIRNNWLTQKNKAFLSFTFHPKATTGLLITQDTVFAFQTMHTNKYLDAIDSLKWAIAEPGRAFEPYASLLYDSLMARVNKILPKESHIIISADGLLRTIPFEILLSDMYKKGDYKNLPYLFKRHTISYLLSAGSQYYIDQLPSEKRDKPSIGAFVGMYNQKTSLSNLQSVTTTLKNLYGTSLTVFEEGKKSSFLENAHAFQYLYLAAHGEADSKNPLDYQLSFSDTSNLRVIELYQMEKPMNADLVVLGACETNKGNLERAEGIIGIARAFVYMGCKNIVTTFNKVPDEPTANILKSFFTYFKNENLSCGEALKKAKIDYLNNPKTEKRYLHPYYFTNLIFIGK